MKWLVLKWLVLALTLASAVGFGYFLGDDPCVGMSYPEQDQCYLDNGYCYAYDTCEEWYWFCSESTEYGDTSSCQDHGVKEAPECWQQICGWHPDGNDDHYACDGDVDSVYMARICNFPAATEYLIDEATYESCEAGTIGLAEIVAAGTEILYTGDTTGWWNICDRRRLGDSHQRRRRGRGRAARARP